MYKAMLTVDAMKKDGLWGLFLGRRQTLTKRGEVSYFDVKALYDLAYEEKAVARNALRRFKKIEARARMMENVYRAQCAPIANNNYKAGV